MEHISDGFKLMAIGMGMVFCFLTLMVIIMNLLSKILAPFAHILEEPATASSNSRPAKKTTASSGGNKNEVVTAITAAVHKYRSEQ